MKRSHRFPADLLGLLVAPVFAMTAIGVIAGGAMSLFNWVAAHR